MLHQRPDDDSRIFSFIRRLMPNANEAELLEASDTFREYMRVVWDIHQRRLFEDSEER